MGEWRKSIETCNKVTFNKQSLHGFILESEGGISETFCAIISKQVIEAKPGHVKGLYRRGMAYMAGGEYEDARNDFNMVYITPKLLIIIKSIAMEICLLTWLYVAVFLDDQSR